MLADFHKMISLVQNLIMTLTLSRNGENLIGSQSFSGLNVSILSQNHQDCMRMTHLIFWAWIISVQDNGFMYSYCFFISIKW